jgi:hypothetical protein
MGKPMENSSNQESAIGRKVRSEITRPMGRLTLIAISD